MQDPQTPAADATTGADTSHIGYVAQIVAAFVSNNTIRSEDLPGLISSIDGAMRDIVGGQTVEAPAEPQEPAVPVRKSITPDYLICLEDGRKFKSLKRHLRTKYNMSPEDYRAKWGLPRDYPMVAPSYAKARSDLAKTMGLGRKPGETNADRAERVKAPKAAKAPAAKKATTAKKATAKKSPAAAKAVTAEDTRAAAELASA